MLFTNDDRVSRSHEFRAQWYSRLGVSRLDAHEGGPHPRLPDGATGMLTSGNKQLLDLAARYARLTHDGVDHSLWSATHVNADVPMTRFRGDCAYVWQRRENWPVNYIASYYYLCSLPPAFRILSLLDDDDLFGAVAVPVGGESVTRDRIDATTEIMSIERRCPAWPNAHILDIGSGYGRLAHRLVQANRRIQVSCVDAIAMSTFLSTYYIDFRCVSDRATVVALDNIESHLAETAIDLAVNIHSFSECTAVAVSWWLKLIAKHRVPQLLVVPNAMGHGGLTLTSTERDGSRRDLLPVFEQRGYSLEAREPKYGSAEMQEVGVSPTTYYWFGLKRC